MTFQNFQLQLETILVVARNISRFVFRDKARILSRFSQHEPSSGGTIQNIVCQIAQLVKCCLSSRPESGAVQNLLAANYLMKTSKCFYLQRHFKTSVKYHFSLRHFEVQLGNRRGLYHSVHLRSTYSSYLSAVLKQ